VKPGLLVLASASPRRAELLKQAGIDFRVLPSRAPEKRAPRESAAAYVKRLSREKAAEVAGRLQAKGQRSGWVLGADTVVVLGSQVLEKPKNAAHARAMLKQLSGRQHQVLTGVSLLPLGEGKAVSIVEKTKVSFRRLSDNEIADYVSGGEPMDKAGSYGIQGKAGAFVKRIEGCFFNVMGLPLSRTVELLKGRR
jgi:septum formation protein